MAGIRVETIREIDKINSTNLEELVKIENYFDEIEDFKRSEKLKLPFVNQENVLEKLVSRLSSNYPYAVLVGEPGIGKSLTVDFLLEILEGKKDIEDYKKELNPRVINSILNLKKRLEKDKVPDTYLFLPQFDNFSHIRPYTYFFNSKKGSWQFMTDSSFSELVLEDLKDYLENYALRNEEKLSKLFDYKRVKFRSEDYKNDFLSGIEKIIFENIDNEEFSKISEPIREWSYHIPIYFTRKFREVEDNLATQLLGIKRFRQVKEKYPEHINYSIEEFLSYDPDTISSPSNIDVNLKKLREELSYRISVLNQEYTLDDLLTQSILTVSQESKVSNLGDLDTGGFVGTIVDVNDITPPHETILSLGEVFQGKILYVKDAFKNFVDFFVNTKEGTASKERLLNWLQNGKFEYVYNGIRYSFNLPKIIIGTDNVNPFEFQEGLIGIRREKGLESRIEKIKVEPFVLSTKKTRTGSLKVIYERVDEFNKQSDSKIKFSDDLVNYLLHKNHLVEGVLNLRYRNLETEIRKICSYAQSRDIENFSLNDFKEMKLDYLSSIYFISLKLKYSDIESFRTDSKKRIGKVNGVAYIDEDMGGVLGEISSNMIYNRSPISPENRFIFEDLDSKLTDETFLKGFSLATNFINNYLSNLDQRLFSPKFGWYVSTQFYKNWEKIGGPSASTAIAVSMISAMANREIGKYNFITGTLEPNGLVGEVGGVYQKSTVPYRLKELSSSKEQFNLLFPVSSLKEFKKDLITDPFGIENKINLIPIREFEQVYGIVTSDFTDSNIGEILSNSYSIGKKRLEEDLIRIEKNLHEKYLPKKKFIFF